MSYQPPSFYLATPQEEGLITGQMGDCISVIALSHPTAAGRYTNVWGQHGAGGLDAIDFAGLVAKGNIPNAMTTRFKVIGTAGQNPMIKYWLSKKIMDMDEENPALFGLAQFEWYCSSNAIVYRDGRVVDKASGNTLNRTFVFIGKFASMLNARA